LHSCSKKTRGVYAQNVANLQILDLDYHVSALTVTHSNAVSATCCGDTGASYAIPVVNSPLSERPSTELTTARLIGKPVANLVLETCPDPLIFCLPLSHTHTLSFSPSSLQSPLGAGHLHSLLSVPPFPASAQVANPKTHPSKHAVSTTHLTTATVRTIADTVQL